MIKIRNLSKDWESFSLENIDLDVKEDEYFVILGPTGAGKTLLLELIAGFHRADDGRIEIDGRDVADTPPENREVGFVYQDYSLFPHLTAEENVRFGLDLRDFSKRETEKKVRETMRKLEIEDLSDRYPRTLSGGEQQRVALARGLVLEPEILLLDEPISALDVPSQEEVRKELKRIHRESDIATIHVTHNREEASWLGDRIGVMKEGRIVQVGTPNRVFQRPKTEFVANFVGTENVFDGEAETEEGISKIDIGGGMEIEAIGEKEGPAKACIRPEEIIISRNPIQSSGRNTFKGKIEEIMEQENTVRLLIDAGKKFRVTITKRSRTEMNLEIGTKVYLAFKASSVHVI